MKTLRILGILAGLAAMAGFGMCGLFALSFDLGTGTGSDSGMVKLLGAGMILICLAAGWGVYKLLRQLFARPPRP